MVFRLHSLNHEQGCTAHPDTLFQQKFSTFLLNRDVNSLPQSFHLQNWDTALAPTTRVQNKRVVWILTAVCDPRSSPGREDPSAPSALKETDLDLCGWLGPLKRLHCSDATMPCERG